MIVIESVMYNALADYSVALGIVILRLDRKALSGLYRTNMNCDCSQAYSFSIFKLIFIEMAKGRSLTLGYTYLISRNMGEWQLLKDIGASIF